MTAWFGIDVPRGASDWPKVEVVDAMARGEPVGASDAG
jgi:hypothetical protein